MPALALVLAVMLHAAVAVGLWLVPPFPAPDKPEEPIMVSFDNAPSNVGLQLPPREGPPPEAEASSPATAPPDTPSPEPAPPPPPQVALAPPGPTPEPDFPRYEFSVPPVPDTPPAPTAREFARPQPPRPVQRTLPLPPRPTPPSPARPPPDRPPASIPAPIPGPNPADQVAGSGRQRNDYLSRLFRHLEPYRARAHSTRASGQHGRVVTRVTVARDGSVMSVSLDTSSGRAAVDAAEIEAIRNGSPFPPIPANMPGDPIVLILRITY